MIDRTESDDDSVYLKAKEARQARWGKPVPFVLIGTIVGAAIALSLALNSIDSAA